MAWRFSYKCSTDQSRKKKSYDFKAEMRNSLFLLECVPRGVMMILPFVLVSGPSVNVCFLIKWHSIFKIKIGLTCPSPFSESVFINYVQDSSAFSPLLKKTAARILNAGITRINTLLPSLSLQFHLLSCCATAIV